MLCCSLDSNTLHSFYQKEEDQQEASRNRANILNCQQLIVRLSCFVQWRHLACTVAEAFELVQWDVSVITPKRAWRNGRPRWNRGGINIRFQWFFAVLDAVNTPNVQIMLRDAGAPLSVLTSSIGQIRSQSHPPASFFSSFFCKDWTVETTWTLEISWHRCNTHGGYTEKKSKKEWMKLHSIFDHMSLRYLVATSDRQSWFILLAELLLYSGCLWIRFVQAYRLQH